MALAPAARADESFDPDPGSSATHALAAGEGRLVSVAADADTESSLHRLVVGFGAAARRLAVRPSPEFGGVDVGTDSGGRAVVVYSRCPKGAFTPSCDLYTYSFARRSETRLRASSKRCAETDPHVERGVLVFSRQPGASAESSRSCPGGIYLRRPGRRAVRVVRPSTRSGYRSDFAGGLVAYSQTRSIEGSPEGDSETQVAEIRLLRLADRRSRLVARASFSSSRGGDEGTILSAPVLDGGFVHWRRTVARSFEDPGPSTVDIVRTPASGRGPTTTLERDGRLYSSGLSSFAVDGNALFYDAFEQGGPHPRIARVSPRPPTFR